MHKPQHLLLLRIYHAEPIAVRHVVRARVSVEPPAAPFRCCVAGQRAAPGAGRSMSSPGHIHRAEVLPSQFVKSPELTCDDQVRRLR